MDFWYKNISISEISCTEKNEKLEEIVEAFEILSKYTIDRALRFLKQKDEDEGAW